ncbi:MAG: 50S ribosomal protein L5 [bacterium]|nr:50S ribosomal protein L5 [bacterium]
MARLKERYQNEVVPELVRRFGYRNSMQVPKVDKVVVNVGVGEAILDVKLLDTVVEELAAITGQQPVLTRAKKSIANFKLRTGMPIGCKVTLRQVRMYEFLDRLINASLPRVRDFRGVNARGFDGRGNYCLGIKEQIIFPEIEYDKIAQFHGLGITIVTTAETDEEGEALLALMGMPFRT